MFSSIQTNEWRAVILFLLLSLPTLPESRAQSTPPSAPATLSEAASVIDFRTFPTLERDKLVQQSAIKIVYSLAKPDLHKDVQFYRDKFTEAGWKIDYEKIDPKLAFGTFRCSKKGFVVDATIFQDPNTKKMQVSLENQGNVDARALPRPPGAEVTQSQPNVTIFLTDVKMDELARFVRSELKRLGWREAAHPNMPADDEPADNLYLNFVQRGMHINVLMNVKNKKIEVMYNAALLKAGLPIMPDAKGRIEFMEEPFLHLGYATPSSPGAVLEFYRKELPALGWTFPPGSDKIENGKAKIALQGPDKDTLRLELLNKGGPTLVLITSQPDGQ